MLTANVFYVESSNGVLPSKTAMEIRNEQYAAKREARALEKKERCDKFEVLIFFSLLKSIPEQRGRRRTEAEGPRTSS